MITQLDASSLIRTHHHIDGWFPFRYSMDIYSGCEYSCAYCRVNWADSKKIIVKKNLPRLLNKELAGWQEKSFGEKGGSLIGMGGGYNEIFSSLNLKHKHSDLAIEKLISHHHLPFLMTQRPDYLLDKIDYGWDENNSAPSKRILVMVSFSSDELETGKPLLPISEEKMIAMEKLIAKGMTVGVLLMPMIPGFDEKNCEVMFKKFKKIGVKFVLTDGLDQGGLEHLLKNQKTLITEKLSQERIELMENMAEDRTVFSKFQRSVKNLNFTLGLKYQIPPLVPFKYVKHYLSLRDQVIVILSQINLLEQLYYQSEWLSSNIGSTVKAKPVREAFKFAADKINELSDKSFEKLVNDQELKKLTWVGDYLSTLISKMVLNQDFTYYQNFINELGFNEDFI